jgi:hypothetical protein
MQLNPTARSDRAFTATEAMIVVVMLMVLAVLAMMWVKDQQAKSEKAARIRCVGNLKNLGLAFKVFANDNDDKFPFATTNVLAGGNDHTLWLHFQAMSNECGSAKILVCPADRERYDNIKSDFSAGPDGLASVGNAAVGFAAGLDASESNPNSILLLDRNLVTNSWNLRGKVLLAFPTRPPAWDGSQHKLRGNLALSDGSVQQVTLAGLSNQVAQAGIATNHLLLPLLP